MTEQEREMFELMRETMLNLKEFSDTVLVKQAEWIRFARELFESAPHAPNCSVADWHDSELSETAKQLCNCWKSKMQDEPSWEVPPDWELPEIH